MIYFSSTLVFLYINDLPQAIVSNSLLYADDTCILFQHKSVIEIEKQLIRVFFSLCDWFVDNKLSAHIWQDRTKSVLFGSEHIWFIKLQNFSLSSRDKIRAWIQVSGMSLYVKIVCNSSITLLFLTRGSVFEYASGVSATAISLTYGCLWWSDCWLGERYV